MVIMSFSAEPFAEASTIFERQVVARADRLPERRASHTVTPMMAATPSRIHSHRSEEPDPLAAGDGEASAGDGEDGSGDGEGDSVDGEGAGAGATAGVVSVGGTVEGGPAEGLGDRVLGGSVAGEDGSVVGVGVSAGASAEAVSEGGPAEGLGDRVLGGSVAGDAVGGETPILLLAAALDKALLILPPPQPATRHPAATIARAAASVPSVLLIAGPSVIRPAIAGATWVSFRATAFLS
jgi:hypothetical protein